MRQLDYAAIREQIPIHLVLALLHWEPASRRGQQWRGPCPLPCSSVFGSQTDRCFSVHVGQDVFQCFRCHRSGNQLDLWVASTSQPIHSATIDLCRQLGITFIALETSNHETVPDRPHIS